MDREISKAVQKREQRKKLIKIGSGIGAGIILVAVVISFLQASLDRKDLTLSIIDKGVIEVSVSASGKVVPAFEEIINSPINSRIVEIYKKGGDSVDVGTPILKLDFNVSRLKLKEEEQKYLNEQELAEADLKVKELELNIFRKGLAEAKRTLDDAQIRSPRKAILTYVNNEVGAQVGQGTKVAIVSDLSHFKIEGEIADTYGDRIAAGSKAVVKIGNDKLSGIVSDVTPLSKNGVISFNVQLEEDSHKRLRSGLKTDVYVMNAIKEDVLRITNASYYIGKGEYELFVLNGDQLLKRKVQLGDSNFEYVEVVNGLEPGDQVVVSDMTNYKDKNKLKVK